MLVSQDLPGPFVKTSSQVGKHIWCILQIVRATSATMPNILGCPLWAIDNRFPTHTCTNSTWNWRSDLWLFPRAQLPWGASKRLLGPDPHLGALDCLNTRRGSYSWKGVFLPSQRLLEGPFLESLLRTLLRTLPLKPTARHLLRTLFRTFSEAISTF